MLQTEVEYKFLVKNQEDTLKKLSKAYVQRAISIQTNHYFKGQPDKKVSKFFQEFNPISIRTRQEVLTKQIWLVGKSALHGTYRQEAELIMDGLFNSQQALDKYLQQSNLELVSKWARIRRTFISYEFGGKICFDINSSGLVVVEVENARNPAAIEKVLLNLGCVAYNPNVEADYFAEYSYDWENLYTQFLISPSVQQVLRDI
jgi:hypothetical protein